MRLIIAEKDKAAARIAEILDKGVQVIKEGKLRVYKIRLGGEEAIVLPLAGHIVDVEFNNDFSSWKNTNLYDIIDSSFVYRPSRMDIARVLRKYGKMADRLTVATDFDREGEAIGREAVSIIRRVNPNVKVDRARFSAITDEEITNAFKEENLYELDEALADSADARREIDLVWGAVLTRFISLASNMLGKNFLSVGRVQTPTLALIVNREKEIKKFVPEKFWVVNALLEKAGAKFKALHKREKFKDKEKAFAVKQKTVHSKEGVVKSVDLRKRKQSRPVPFNTNEFLRAAASLGVSPVKAIQIAENLYMSGYVSYPRTDNTVYPSSINLKEIVSKFLKSEFSEEAKTLLQGKLIPSRGKMRTTDHPPIHPTGVAKKSKLDSQSWKIYELIVRRFFATLAEDAQVASTRVEIDINGEGFVAKGQTIVKRGWLEFYPYSKVKEEELPGMNKGDVVQVISVDVVEKETQPPNRYTPASLLKEMEKLGLGTKSTRPAIIQKLINRSYISGKKNYQPSDIAFRVVDSLEKHARDITLPDMTAKLEKEMEKISAGDILKSSVVIDSKTLLRKALSELEANKEVIGADIKEGAKLDRIKARMIGKCKCGGELVIRRSRKTGKRFVACNRYPDCKEIYPLPQKGKVVPTGKTCPKCGTPVVRIYTKRGSYEMCLDPNCETKKDWGKRNKKHEVRANRSKSKKVKKGES